MAHETSLHDSTIEGWLDRLFESQGMLADQNFAESGAHIPIRYMVVIDVLNRKDLDRTGWSLGNQLTVSSIRLTAILARREAVCMIQLHGRFQSCPALA